MIVKVIEIRDRGTFIPAIAIKLGSDVDQERWLLSRAGYGRSKSEHEQYILLCRIVGGAEECHDDPYKWGQNPRTYFVAHDYLSRYFDDVPHGGVVDVEYILGERTEAKLSERETAPHLRDL